VLLIAAPRRMKCADVARSKGGRVQPAAVHPSFISVPAHRPEEHRVQFYETDTFLAEQVARFIAEGIPRGEPAVIIATQAHRDAFVRALLASGASVERLSDDGRLVMLDARETLTAFTVDGQPSWERFRDVVGGLMTRVAARHPGVSIRAYGEMVDLLWRDGKQDDAIRLEEMWNDLRNEHAFSLLCAYVIDSFYKENGIPRICATHSHVLAPERSRAADPSSVAASVQSLVAEIARRIDLEHELRASLRRAHQAEQEAVTAKEDLADFLANAVVPIHRVDRDGIIRWANQAELDLLGYEPHEYIGHHITEFHVDRAVIDDILARLSRCETLHDCEARLRTKRGDVRVVKVSSNVQVRNGEFHTTRCFSRDVTEEKHADRRAAVLHRLSSALSRALSAEEAASVVSMEARDVVGAPAGAVLLLEGSGTAVERVFTYGENPVSIATILSSAPLEANLPLCEATRTGKLVWLAGPDVIDARYPHLASVRAEVDAQTWGAVPIVFEGRTRGAIGFRLTSVRPLSVEEETLLLAIGQHCGQAIERARLHDAAEAARADAEHASRAKDEFLAILGHELRNPLSPILTAVQLMRLRGESGSVREQNIIERQVNHLIHIVDDLLDISRVARGKIQLELRPIKLRSLLTKAVEITSPLFEAKRQRLDVRYLDDEIWLEADETRLCQVLTNLLSNASKYTPARGHITIDARRDQGRITIRVRDDGNGITPDLLPRVFDLFVQGTRGTERHQGGLGIGLALVRNLVRLHGGTVAAHSAGAGHGSEFTVDLPAVDVPASAPLSPDTEWELRRRVEVTARRILVVDDNEDAGQLLGEMLRSVGHEVVIAIDAPTALEVVKTFSPDIAILDIGLPVMDGYELAVALRSALGTSVRLLALSGYGQQQDKERAFASGFEAHFVKPVSLKKVLAAVEVDPKAG
jgi:PAS domain S-box-containing protein